MIEEYFKQEFLTPLPALLGWLGLKLTGLIFTGE
jgi:hypothetical protein